MIGVRAGKRREKERAIAVEETRGEVGDTSNTNEIASIVTSRRDTQTEAPQRTQW